MALSRAQCPLCHDLLGVPFHLPPGVLREGANCRGWEADNDSNGGPTRARVSGHLNECHVLTHRVWDREHGRPEGHNRDVGVSRDLFVTPEGEGSQILGRHARLDSAAGMSDQEQISNEVVDFLSQSVHQSPNLVSVDQGPYPCTGNRNASRSSSFTSTRATSSPLESELQQHATTSPHRFTSKDT